MIIKDVVKVRRVFFFSWHLPMIRRFLITQSFTREYEVWKTVSGLPKLWPLHGFSISIDVDFEDVSLLLVSPLSAGDLTNISNDDLNNKDQIVTFVSASGFHHCQSLSL